MRPLAVITGIIAGSCVAITVSLAAVMLVYFILGGDYPRVRYEFKPLVASTLLFLGMTTISTASFYTLVTNHRWAVWLQGLLWAGVAATVYYYLP
jgi:hypothetical protein